MADDNDGRPDEPLILLEVVEEPRAKRPDDAGGLRQAMAGLLQAIGQTGARFGLTPRSIATVAVALVAVIGLAVGLAQGLTASFRSAWPTRVPGIAEQATNTVSLSGGVERTMPVVPAGYQKVAGVHDMTEVSDRRGSGIGIAPDGESYLPPRDRSSSDYQPAGVQITIPVSQGRLLRFDEAVESVFIADPAIADIRVVSPDLVYVYGKKLGHTNMMAISGRAKEGGEAAVRLTGSALLKVVADSGPPTDAKQAMAPEAPADVMMFGTRAVVKGRFQTVDQAVDVANVAQMYSREGRPPINGASIDGSNQINIRVRFAEVSRNDLRSFGIDWGVSAKAGTFNFGVEKKTASFDLNPNFTAGGKVGNFDIDVLIEALQANGALTVLAEPNLTAVTGETASFLAGGEVPIPVPNGDSGNSITVQYKPFGVSLSFMPTIVKEGRIGLRVKPEVSSISANTSFAVQGFNLPSFTVRRAETVVEVASGQTFALAGLFQREVSRSVDKLPVLGDVPVLGPLFRSERYQRNETELVILITPYLVNPVSDRELATPLDRTDFSSSWQANIVSPDPTEKGAALTSQGPENSSGFILK
ncbi:MULTISPECIES: type II and III secretion system protein family protein [Rhodomicrobium]|uniref:type II and III secretion system protein family protein n=1 Tax=Rhodomicrobium TaxID=1068 RepID=UPI000B4B54A9|nr:MULTISPECIES: type II and III secretion system protein family protein [Rhodomicrobium]